MSSLTIKKYIERLCKNGSKVAVLYSPVFQTVVAVRLTFSMRVRPVVSPLVGIGCNFVCHFDLCYFF